ncbi:hypothetical protein ACQPVP_09180 [Clostridium nigeriense]|uniref:hypothetical protein n=1 Tax=Clostridium nigeriense TaxID=1805470 RepID=UPI003D32DE5A
MGKRIDFKEFVDSQYAIRDYMNSKAGNDYIHEARVLVSYRGETKYNSILKVVPSIETNNSFIDIIGDLKFSRDYYMKYTNEYHKFDFINGTLLIKGEDRWGNTIEIDITSV